MLDSVKYSVFRIAPSKRLGFNWVGATRFAKTFSPIPFRTLVVWLNRALATPGIQLGQNFPDAQNHFNLRIQSSPLQSTTISKLPSQWPVSYPA